MTMAVATISSKYQIVIPKHIRERLDLRPGQKLGWLVKGKTVSLVLLRPIEELEGIAAGASMEGYREEEDRY
jgi:AbrB family looped-hinge helix DNA binding protein